MSTTSSNGPDRTPGTPDRQRTRDTTVRFVKATCPIHGLVVVNPNTITVNAAAQDPTYQWICPACTAEAWDHAPSVITVTASKASLALLAAASTPRVERGVDADIEAGLLGVTVYGTEPVPVWPADTDGWLA